MNRATKVTFSYSGSILSTRLAATSTRFTVTPEIATAGIAGLWEYTCTSPMTVGAVLGASTDIYSEISKTLGTIGALLNAIR